MPRMTDVRTVAANATVDNVLSGKTEEFITRPTAVRILIVAAAAGLRGTVLASGSTQLDDQEVSSANRYPIVPDDVVCTFGLTGPTDRLVVRLRNTTGAGIAVTTLVDTEPVA